MGATIPFVGGTVDNHKKPKVTPNTTEVEVSLLVELT